MNEDSSTIWYSINGENTNYYSNGSLWTNISTITTNYNVGNTVDEKISKLEKEIKELRKIIARLSTMVCTHIGQEQLKNFNNEQ